MSKRKQYSPGQKVAIVRRHLLENVPVSDLCDEYGIHAKQGYSRILGLRDVRPTYSRREIPNLERVMAKAIALRLPSSPLPFDVLLAVMEIEAWFLADSSHFEKIGLTCKTIKDKLAFDPSTDSVEMVDHPAVLLNKIYKLVGRSYKKKKWQAKAVVNRLDYAHLYFDMCKEVPRLEMLVEALDLFLNSEQVYVL